MTVAAAPPLVIERRIVTRDRPFEAVIADMDGVITRTARLHERAWARMFDELLRGYPGQRPFSAADYRAYLDGRPRYAGIVAFLSSRQLALPYGDPSDGPDQPTVCGLGNRKNAYYLELLDREGAEVFEDAVAALARWRRAGLKLAIVSASRNCPRVLRSVDLERRVDVIVDGQLAAELGLGGKAEIMLEAARRLGVDPADAVIVEDATAGVRAGRQDGFGLVVGVARDRSAADLREAGADVVVHRVSRARFLRRLPDALTRLDELAALQGERGLAVFLDYDGTLTPIVGHPRDAWMSDATRAAVRALAARCPVAIISGRDRGDVEERVGLDGLVYAGNHGFDIAGRGHHRAFPEAEQARGEVDRAAAELDRHLGRIAGVLVEHKRFSVAVHYRLADTPAVIKQIEQAVDGILATTTLRKRTGKKVFELEPAVDWDKGRALEWLLDVLQVDPAHHLVVYVGDDETDEDAFATLETTGIGVRVGEEISTSIADYRVADPEEVRALLDWLAARCGPRPSG